MGNYVEQSKNVFLQMQEQMQKNTEQVLGAFGIKRPLTARRTVSGDNRGYERSCLP